MSRGARAAPPAGLATHPVAAAPIRCRRRRELPAAQGVDDLGHRSRSRAARLPDLRRGHDAAARRDDVRLGSGRLHLPVLPGVRLALHAGRGARRRRVVAVVGVACRGGSDDSESAGMRSRPAVVAVHQRHLGGQRQHVHGRRRLLGGPRQPRRRMVVPGPGAHGAEAHHAAGSCVAAVARAVIPPRIRPPLRRPRRGGAGERLRARLASSSAERHARHELGLQLHAVRVDRMVVDAHRIPPCGLPHLAWAYRLGIGGNRSLRGRSEPPAVAVDGARLSPTWRRNR